MLGQWIKIIVSFKTFLKILKLKIQNLKFLVNAFPLIFFIFFYNSHLKAEINCSSPVHKKKAICKSKSKDGPKIDPKEFIEKVTVLIQGNGKPGSGVIVNKEGNMYTVLTSAHVVCSRGNQLVDTEEYAVKTFDGFWHDSSNDSNLSVKCPPILKGQEKIDKFCSAPINEAYPWPIDLAVLEFKSTKEYIFVKRSSSIKQLGKDVYISGYPLSGDGKFVIRESQGTLDIPPTSINETCKGYGLRYTAPTEIGMDGGGVWSKKGKLVGIHGYREVSRENNIVLSRGSFSTGIHIPYWKQLVDPFDPSRGLRKEIKQNNREDDVAALISRAKSFININRSSKINNNSNFIIEEESSEVLEGLKRAEKLDRTQALIPALIAQIYIRTFEDDGSKEKEYLTEALSNISRAIRLQKPDFWEPRDSHDGRYEKIRAYVHFLYGKLIDNEDSILSYRYAIDDIDTRLSLVPNDVASWKDKANYHFYAKDLGNAYASLIRASKLSPKDPSIFIDMAFILVENKEYENACKDFNRAINLINEGFSRQGSQGDYAKDYEDQKKRMKPFTDALGC